MKPEFDHSLGNLRYITVLKCISKVNYLSSGHFYLGTLATRMLPPE